MTHRPAHLLLFTLLLLAATSAIASDKPVAHDLFTGPVPVLSIEIPPEGMEILRQYNQVWREEKPPRIDVRATLRHGDDIYVNVAVHLKGTFSFQPIDAKPSLTLNFDKFECGQEFHGLTKIHLNNAVQDPTTLSEQFARELFIDLGLPAPRATPAHVQLNGRDLGLCVLVEGANKGFVKRNFGSAKGNLYDGGSGGDVTKELETDAGENPDDRSDLASLVSAAREPDPIRRRQRLEEVLDVDHFITFAAIEAILVHWDGYAIGANNYRLFHDVDRKKMIFIPHGLDQLFGVSSLPTLSITPPFKGMVAKALFTIPEARQRYLRRVEDLFTNKLSLEAMNARLDRLAERLRPALSEAQVARADAAVQRMKMRMAQRTASIAEQLKNPTRPLVFPEDGVLRLTNWRFRGGSSAARGSRTIPDGRELLRVTSGGDAASAGSWRTSVLLSEGHYEFTGLARTSGLAAAPPANAKQPIGVILRISGERSTDGIAITDEWKPLTYSFDVRGIEDIELVAEYRGAQGFGEFDAGTLRLVRKGPARDLPPESP